MLREPSGRWQHCLQRKHKKPWQLPYHSFQHDVMACSPAPVAFDMRQYMPQLTPVTGAEASLEWPKRAHSLLAKPQDTQNSGQA